MSRVLFPLVLRCWMWLLCLLFLAVAPVCVQGAVPYSQPEHFEGQFRPLLTPFETVLSGRAKKRDDDPSGAVLLSECVERVESDGRRLMVYQVSYETITQAGVRSNGEDIFTYRKGWQKLYVVQAETVQPDGTHQSVQPDAVLEQSPQRQADYALYDDQVEVRIIYPNVQPGTVTHAIVAIEDLKPRMSREWRSGFYWGWSWPADLTRFVADLPAEMASRLKIKDLGSGVPPPTKEEPEKGRERLTWTVRSPRTQPYEVSRAPNSQVGPGVALTTIENWDRIAAWFNTLADGNREPGGDLATALAGWVDGTKDRSEKIKRIFTHVANDVRYVGLELGESDYQPHDCNLVWANRYGDCKDKANLLAALLRRAGVPASIALVNTNHVGLIRRDSPDYTVFDHAITAIPDGHGGYLFCDPTIDYGEAGQIRPDSADRDVLVVDGAHGIWAHTPAQAAGSTSYDFDLKIDEAGGLSGWMTIRAEGYEASLERSRYSRLDAPGTRRRMTDIVRAFFSGADVVDATSSALDSKLPDGMEKAYFVVGLPKEEMGGGRTLPFPWSQSMLYDLGDSSERDTSFPLRKERVAARMAVQLPSGWSTGTLPAPLILKTAVGSTKASWKMQGSTCRTELVVELDKTVLRATDFAQFYQADKSLRAWLDHPLELVQSASGAVASQASTPNDAAELDLPLLPTGDGEIDLVDKRYPASGNKAQRRAALERVLQYFPNDRSTAFRIGVRIAYDDWQADKSQETLDRLTPLLAGYRADVSRDIYAWGQTIDALALRDVNRKREALDIFLRLAREDGLDPWRRQNAAINAFDMHSDDLLPPDQAAELLASVADFATDNQKWCYTRLAHLWLSQGRGADLEAKLAAMEAADASSSEAVLQAIVDDLADWKETGDEALQERMLAIIQRAGASLEGQLKSSVANASDRLNSARLGTKLQDAVKAALSQGELGRWWVSGEQVEPSKNVKECRAALSAAESANQPDHVVRLGLQTLVSVTPDAEYTELLWLVAAYADWQERVSKADAAPGLLVFLLEQLDQIPQSDGYYVEGQFLRARRLGRTGDIAGQRALYQGMLAREDLPGSFRAPAFIHLGESFEPDDAEEALQAFLQLEPYADTLPAATEHCLHAVLLNLELGRDDEALRILGVLSHVPENVLSGVEDQQQLRELVGLASTGNAAKYWAATREWWPYWQRLAAASGLPIHAQEESLPLLGNVTTLGRALGTAVRAGDKDESVRIIQLVASSCRWQPSMPLQLWGVWPVMQNLFSGRATDVLNQYVILMRADPPQSDASRRGWLLCRAAVNTEAHRFEDVMTTVADFDKIPATRDGVTFAVHCVWGIAARQSGLQQAEAISALTRDLEEPADYGAGRGKSVQVLADLLRTTNQTDAEITLLTRELQKTQISSDAGLRADLGRRLQVLNSGQKLSEAILRWIGTAPLPWYDLAEPSTLDDDLRAKLKELTGPGATLPPATQSKLLLLGTLDDSQDSGARMWGFLAFCRRVSCMLPDAPSARRFWSSLVDNADFTEPTRLALLDCAIWDSVGQFDKEGAAYWHERPLNAKRPRGSPPDWKEAYDTLAATNLDDDTALQALATTLTRGQVKACDLGIIGNVLCVLKNRGRRDLLDGLATASLDWRPSAELKNDWNAWQLLLDRLLGAGRETEPIHELFVSIVRKHFGAPKEGDTAPAIWWSQRLARTPVRAPEVAWQLDLWAARKGDFPREDLHFEGRFLNRIRDIPEAEEVAREFVPKALAAATTDDVASQACLILFSSCDRDDPAILGRLEKWLAPLSAHKDWPRAGTLVQLIEATAAVRTGGNFDLRAFMAAPVDPSLRVAHDSFVLELLLRDRSVRALNGFLDSVPPQELLSSGLCARSLQAYQLCGRSRAAELARRSADGLLNTYMAEARASSDFDTLRKALDIIDIIGDDTVPEWWWQWATHDVESPDFRALAAILQARGDWDWVAMERNAKEYLSRHPTMYRFYWYLGYAQAKLSRPEAREALETYTNHARDEPEWGEAMELLAGLPKRRN